MFFQSQQVSECVRTDASVVAQSILERILVLKKSIKSYMLFDVIPYTLTAISPIIAKPRLINSLSGALKRIINFNEYLSLRPDKMDMAIEEAISKKLLEASQSYPTYMSTGIDKFDNFWKYPQKFGYQAPKGLLLRIGGSFDGPIEPQVIGVEFPQPLFLNEDKLRIYIISTLFSYIKENSIRAEFNPESIKRLFTDEVLELFHSKDVSERLAQANLLNMPKVIVDLIISYLYSEPEQSLSRACPLIKKIQ